jgi:hypothetical protein
VDVWLAQTGAVWDERLEVECHGGLDGTCRMWRKAGMVASGIQIGGISFHSSLFHALTLHPLALQASNESS